MRRPASSKDFEHTKKMHASVLLCCGICMLSLCVFIYMDSRDPSLDFNTRAQRAQVLPSCRFDELPVLTRHKLQGTGETRGCTSTLVTGYFDITSKHTHSVYSKWIENLANNSRLNLCLLVFTDSPGMWFPSVEQVVINTTLCDEALALNQSEIFWRNQWFRDPEAAAHKGFPLYLVWNLKAYFLQEATRLNPFQSEYYFWIDAGYMRSADQAHGDARTMAPNVDKDAMHFLLIDHFSRAELEERRRFHYTVGQDRLGGGMFGGHVSAVVPWVQLYYQTLGTYVARGWFVGKDQNIMNTLCIENPTACVLLDPNVWVMENPWFKMWECLFGQRHCSVVHTTV